VRPVLAIVGGAKVSSKIELLKHLVTKVDALAIGGGMANTFLFARGHAVGKSLCERDLIETAKEIEAIAKAAGCTVRVPVAVSVLPLARVARAVTVSLPLQPLAM
jgi:phosphoglycerate kinase